MHHGPRSTASILVTTYLIVLHVVALYLVVDRVTARYAPVPAPETGIDQRTSPSAAEPDTETAVGMQTPNKPAASPPNPMQSPVVTDPGGLIIPVMGVRGSQLVDSFADARSSERVHDAIDIAAPAGTAVLAAADGEIVRFFESELGGITIYQLSSDRRYVYYYAHLQRRADDIKVGDVVTQGKTIAYVGDTGNAGAGNYHLHFSIAAIANPKRYWEGTYINPYPLLRGQGK